MDQKAGGTGSYMSIRDKFNHMLSNNTALNAAYDIKEHVKQVQKGNTVRLLRNLLIGSYSTMLLSFLASVIGYGASGKYLLVVIISNFLGVIINNLVFVTFLQTERGVCLDLEGVRSYLHKAIPQLLCAVLLTLCQSVVTTAVLQITSFVPTLNVVSSIVISLVFTALQALTAFHIFDGTTTIKVVISNSFTLFLKNWKSLLMLSMLFITWSYGFNVAFAQLLYNHLEQQQGINNIFHSLLQQQDYRNFLYMNLFNLVNYLVAGFLEIKIILGIAHIYEKIKR